MFSICISLKSSLKTVVNALVEMEVPSPDELIPPIKSAAENFGTILETMLGIPQPPAEVGNSTDENPCKSLAPIDKANADKPGVMEYETDIGDSGMFWICICNIRYLLLS